MGGEGAAGGAAPALDAAHPKMQAFQSALREALMRRLRREEDAIRVAERDARRKRDEKVEQQRRLHEAQLQLQREEEKLEAATAQLREAAANRRERERQALKEAAKLQERRARLGEEQQRRDQLRKRLNRVLESQIALESRRVEMAGEVAAGNTEATKAEKDFRDAQEDKRTQDLYLDGLERQAEELEQRSVEYLEQSAGLAAKTEQLRSTVREAEAEAERVRRERKEVVQRWTGAVVNIAKRDDAIRTFEEALSQQELRAKGVAAEAEGVKREVVRRQERHDHLTTVEQRTERICANRKAQIKQAEELIVTAVADLDKASKARRSTEKTLAATTEEAAVVDKEVAGAQVKIQSMDLERKGLEEQVLLLLREGTTARKSGEYTDRIVRSLREEVDRLEERTAKTQDLMAAAAQEAAEKSTMLREQEAVKRRMQQHADGLHKELDKLEQGLLRTQAAIDKKQNSVDVKLKHRARLQENRAKGEGEGSAAAANPLEAEIARVRREIGDTVQYCNEAKARWLKFQQDYIGRTEARSEMSSRLVESTRRFLIMSEKRRKLDSELEAMEASGERLRRRIEARDGLVRRLSKRVHGERDRYAGAVEALQAKQVRDNDALGVLAEEAEAAQAAAAGLAEEVEREKEEVVRAEAGLHEWEERVRACRITKDAVASGREGELNQLKAEVHLLKTRAEAVDRQTRSLVEHLKGTVSRREDLVDRATQREEKARRMGRRPQVQQALAAKRADDMRNRIKKMSKEEANLKLVLAKTKEKETGLGQELERNVAFLQKIRESIMSVECETRERRSERDRKLAQVVRLQTRAKWYRAVKEKKYRMASSMMETAGGGGGPGSADDKEDHHIVDAATLAGQNESLQEAMNRLAVDFPYLEESLRRVRDLM